MITDEELEILNTFLDNENNAEDITDNKIPVNSPTALQNDNTTRFSGALWYDKIQLQLATVVGVGGIGSWLTFFLSRLGLSKIYIYDPDRVESVNMAGQLYKLSDINDYKTDAINKTCREFSNYFGINSFRQKVSEDTPFFRHVFTGLDNMDGRKYSYYRWKESLVRAGQRDKCIFIDGRLTANMFQIFAITGDDLVNMAIYENQWLFNDNEAVELPCSFKQTSHIAAMIASVMTNIYINYIAKVECGIEYTVPFITTYNADMMNFNITL